MSDITAIYNVTFGEDFGGGASAVKTYYDNEYGYIGQYDVSFSKIISDYDAFDADHDPTSIYDLVGRLGEVLSTNIYGSYIMSSSYNNTRIHNEYYSSQLLFNQFSAGSPGGTLSYATTSRMYIHTSGSQTYNYQTSDIFSGIIANKEIEGLDIYSNFGIDPDIDFNYIDTNSIRSNISGTIRVQEDYIPKTATQYIDDALEYGPNYRSSEYQTVLNSITDVVVIRNSSSETASQNLNLRDAEYFLRGYAGGLAVRNNEPVSQDFLNEIGNRGGPAAWAAYQFGKVLTALRFESPADHGQTPLLQGGPAELAGYVRGLTNETVGQITAESSLLSLDTPNAILGLALVAQGIQFGISQSIGGVIIPSITTTINNFKTNVFDYVVDKSNAILNFDPPTSGTYGFYIYKNAVSSILVPTEDNTGSFELNAQGRTFSLTPGVAFDVHAAGLQNLTSFALSGKTTAQEFVIGLGFDNIGETIVAESTYGVLFTVFPETSIAVSGNTVTGSGGIAGSGALAGDSTPSGDTLRVSSIDHGSLGQAVAGAYGNLTLNADGSYSYVADNLLAISEAQAAAGVYSQIQLTGTSADIRAIQNAAIAQPLHDRFSFTVTDGSGNTGKSTLDVAVYVVNAGAPNSDVALPGPGNASTVVHYDGNGLISSIVQTNANGSIDTFSYNVTSDGHLVPNETHQQPPASDPFAFNRDQFGTVAHDATSHAGQVYALYEGLLGRAPDILGLEFWADQFDHGASPANLAAGFLASPEGQARLGASDDAGFVNQLYQNTLGRSGDAGGFTYWTNQLAHGTSRVDVADSFVFSSEFTASVQQALASGLFVPDAQAGDVARLYYTMLDRAPDAGGLQYWTNQLDHGGSLSSLAQGFLSTPENQAKYGSLANSAYVDALYENALGRHADAGGLDYWTHRLDSGVSRADLAVQLSDSPESHTVHLPQIEQGWHLA